MAVLFLPLGSFRESRRERCHLPGVVRPAAGGAGLAVHRTLQARPASAVISTFLNCVGTAVRRCPGRVVVRKSVQPVVSIPESTIPARAVIPISGDAKRLAAMAHTDGKIRRGMERATGLGRASAYPLAAA